MEIDLNDLNTDRTIKYIKKSIKSALKEVEDRYQKEFNAFYKWKIYPLKGDDIKRVLLLRFNNESEYLEKSRNYPRSFFYKFSLLIKTTKELINEKEQANNKIDQQLNCFWYELRQRYKKQIAKEYEIIFGYVQVADISQPETPEETESEINSETNVMIEDLSQPATPEKTESEINSGINLSIEYFSQLATPEGNGQEEFELLEDKIRELLDNKNNVDWKIGIVYKKDHPKYHVIIVKDHINLDILLETVSMLNSHISNSSFELKNYYPDDFYYIEGFIDSDSPFLNDTD